MMVKDDNSVHFDRIKAQYIWDLGQRDEQYYRMLQELKPLEDKFESLLQQLTEEQQNIICDFVYHCEGMSWRMLEFACSYIDIGREK